MSAGRFKLPGAFFGILGGARRFEPAAARWTDGAEINYGQRFQGVQYRRPLASAAVNVPGQIRIWEFAHGFTAFVTIAHVVEIRSA